jgi:vitamin B12 transporter
VAYQVRETDTRLRASYGTGFKAPTLFQLFGQTAFSTGNPNLQPEESKGWEVGIDQKLAGGRIETGTTYFQTDIKNLIDSDPTFTTFINIGRSTQHGLESYIAVRPIPELVLRVDHTYVSSEDDTNGQQLLRRPQHKINASANLSLTEKWDVGAGVIYNGSRADIDPVSFGRVYPGGYTVVRATTRYAINDNWMLFGRVENLLDRRYENPEGFNQPGIGGFAGVRAKF